MSMRSLLLVLTLAWWSMPAATSAPAAISRLQLDFTAAAQKQTDDDARFHAGALRRTLGEVLTARGLADLRSDAVVNVAAIEVDEFDVRATSNLVLMGRVASMGVLGGTVRIRDGAGKALRELHVRAELPLKLSKKGSDSGALAGLYEEFAELIAAEIGGTVKPQR
jgi:hypothetical protein